MLLLVAWDGASFEIADPLIGAGKMPTLGRLLDGGARCELASTWPAVTYPAWTSFMTAASPGRHGVLDFVRRSGYTLQFVNSTHRHLPTIWRLMGDAGLRVGVYALPATFPPEPINGLQVCGFDTPLGSGGAVHRTHPEALAGELLRRYGRLAIEGIAQNVIGPGWHDRALARMLDDIELRTRIVTDLLSESPFDVFMVHYGESDTVAHQHWHLSDPWSPRYVGSASDTPRGQLLPDSPVEKVYRALDEALARLLAVAGADATVVVLSDHGAGGSSDRVLFWNRWLAEHDWLTFKRSRARVDTAMVVRRTALRLVPESLQARVFSALPEVAARVEGSSRLGGIDWPRSRVFSAELNYFPALWLNLRGRDPEGTVDASDAPRVAADLTADLMAFRDPFDGLPVVEAVHPRESLYDGPYAIHAPDLILELRDPDGYSYAGGQSRGGAESCSLRRMRPREGTGARGTSMAGAHRRTGLWVSAGPRIRPGRYPAGDLPGAGATVLQLAGLATSEPLDGRPWTDMIEGAGRRLEKVRPPPIPDGEMRSDPRTERELAARLRALGYIE